MRTSDEYAVNLSGIIYEQFNINDTSIDIARILPYFLKPFVYVYCGNHLFCSRLKMEYQMIVLLMSTIRTSSQMKSLNEGECYAKNG